MPKAIAHNSIAMPAAAARRLTPRTESEGIVVPVAGMVSDILDGRTGVIARLLIRAPLPLSAAPIFLRDIFNNLQRRVRARTRAEGETEKANTELLCSPSSQKPRLTMH